MSARVSGWLLTTELKIWPGRRVSMGPLLRDGQPWRFPIDCTSLGMAVLVEGEPSAHELGFALSNSDGEQILAPLILNLECQRDKTWLFLERGPHKIEKPGTYFVDISLDGEIVEEAQMELLDITEHPLG